LTSFYTYFVYETVSDRPMRTEYKCFDSHGQVSVIMLPVRVDLFSVFEDQGGKAQSVRFAYIICVLAYVTVTF
jgi:hypothetical protein